MSPNGITFDNGHYYILDNDIVYKYEMIPQKCLVVRDIKDMPDFKNNENSKSPI